MDITLWVFIDATGRLVIFFMFLFLFYIWPPGLRLSCFITWCLWKFSVSPFHFVLLFHFAHFSGIVSIFSMDSVATFFGVYFRRDIFQFAAAFKCFLIYHIWGPKEQD